MSDPLDELIAAAMAVVERWNSPGWKEGVHTGHLINRLHLAAGVALAAQPHDEPPASMSREQAVSAMSVELQKHAAFKDDPIKSLVWASRLYDAAQKEARKI